MLQIFCNHCNRGVPRPGVNRGLAKVPQMKVLEHLRWLLLHWPEMDETSGTVHWKRLFASCSKNVHVST